MEYIILFSLMFGLDLVNEFYNSSNSVCYVQCAILNTKIICLDSIGFPY